MGQLLRGAPLAAAIEDEVRKRSEALAARGKKAALAALRSAADPASDLYLKRQAEAALRLGLAYRVVDVEPRADALTAALLKLNSDPEITGIIVQSPLPDGCDLAAIQGLVAPEKDVEAVHPRNLGALMDSSPRLVPCTAGAIMECLAATGVPVAGAEAVVVGRSRIVGRPVALLLTEKSATVTLCHSRTRDLGAATRRADIVVLAVGKPGLLAPDMVKPGAIVVDVGINRVPRDGKSVVVGDADPAVAEVAAWFTPTPGGVGPVTVALLWRNAVAAAEAL